MYDDILGETDKIREIRNRKFNNKKEEKEDIEFDLFEDLDLEMEDEI
jgi:hypothetical protein